MSGGMGGEAPLIDVFLMYGVLKICLNTHWMCNEIWTCTLVCGGRC